jgi:hypothetical protein
VAYRVHREKPEDCRGQPIERTHRHSKTTPRRSPPDFILPQQIHHVVVYGDAAKDDVLSLLRTILGVDLVRNAYISDSVSDGVNYIAHSVHEAMDTVEFEMRFHSASGCQWRSKLYSEDLFEL